jgi:hypothetical protein
LGRFWVLVSGSYTEVQCTANQALLAKFSIAPFADIRFRQVGGRIAA